MQKLLMLGSGFSLPRRRLEAQTSEQDVKWVTLDMNPECNPDHVFDLAHLEQGADLPEGEFDEIHAYEVLEHFGQQGHFKGLFNTFNGLWRALVPGGLLLATCPAHDSRWKWGDPGHTRAITNETISFLAREHYKQLGRTTSTDYRRYIDPHWWEIMGNEEKADTFSFCLRRV